MRANFDGRDGKEIYATSRDRNLRELEIDFIISRIRETAHSADGTVPVLLDIGCGNGYTDIRIAESLKVEITGIDFSGEMIAGAHYLKERWKDKTIVPPVFKVGDVRSLDWADGSFDIVLSERCLLNLPDRETQYRVIREVRRVLKKGGTYIMVEGTRDGLRRLNELRIKVGLEPIPDRAEDNISSLKFEEEEILQFLSGYFRIVEKQHFGTYYLISRVIHPLLVAPDPPKFDAGINEIARRIAARIPDCEKMGHVMGLVLEAV